MADVKGDLESQSEIGDETLKHFDKTPKPIIQTPLITPKADSPVGTFEVVPPLQLSNPNMDSKRDFIIGL